MTEDTGLVLGAGSPIVDLVAEVSEDFIGSIAGDKGGMELVGPGEMDGLLDMLDRPPKMAAGGSAANTVFALARLGIGSAMLGKVGLDEAGGFYRSSFAAAGGDTSRLKTTSAAPTARCLSLVTPDSERTMRTYLGAAALMAPEDVSAADFEACRHLHVEGYLLFNPELITVVLSSAERAGCSVSLDLGSFEVVETTMGILPGLLEQYVDMVFSNEDEGRAFCGDEDPEAALAALAECCENAVVKLGADGSLLRSGGETRRAEAITVDRPVDTTGAGDFWAAGFLYGLLKGRSLTEAGRYGSIMGAEVVGHMGAELSEESWVRVIAELK